MISTMRLKAGNVVRLTRTTTRTIASVRRDVRASIECRAPLYRVRYVEPADEFWGPGNTASIDTEWDVIS